MNEFSFSEVNGMVASTIASFIRAGFGAPVEFAPCADLFLMAYNIHMSVLSDRSAPSPSRFIDQSVQYAYEFLI